MTIVKGREKLRIWCQYWEDKAWTVLSTSTTYPITMTLPTTTESKGILIVFLNEKVCKTEFRHSTLWRLCNVEWALSTSQKKRLQARKFWLKVLWNQLHMHQVFLRRRSYRFLLSIRLLLKPFRYVKDFHKHKYVFRIRRVKSSLNPTWQLKATQPNGLEHQGNRIRVLFQHLKLTKS